MITVRKRLQDAVYLLRFRGQFDFHEKFSGKHQSVNRNTR